jgi:hypothetical protein
MHTCYLRRRGDYAYSVEIHEVTRPAIAHRFRAHLSNIVRLGPRQTVSINATLQAEYATTRDEAFSRIEAAVEKWVKDVALSVLTASDVEPLGDSSKPLPSFSICILSSDL